MLMRREKKREREREKEGHGDPSLWWNKDALFKSGGYIYHITR